MIIGLIECYKGYYRYKRTQMFILVFYLKKKIRVIKNLYSSFLNMTSNYSERSWDRIASKYQGGYDKIAVNTQWKAPDKLTMLATPYFDEQSPVLDVGSGTGLSGIGLIRHGFVVDGIDFSGEMLKKAQEKGYRRVTKADLSNCFHMQQLYDRPNEYRNMISVGVFGESVAPEEIKSVFPLLDTPATIAIAGNVDVLEDKMEKELIRQNFSIHHREIEIAYYTNIKGRPINFLYIIASRK